ncbi:MAG: efflux RND transporter periplasmic adaptor subunit [Verrucomicrobiota bacterium]
MFRISVFGFRICLPLLLVGCNKGGNSGGPPPEPPPTMVDFGKVTQQPVEDLLGAVGSVEANESVDIKAEAAGTVKAIHFTEGKPVKKGEKLFELNSEKEAAQLDKARAEEQLARQSLERAQKLSGTKAISQQEIDQWQSQVAALAAARKLQEERLKDFVMYAPFDAVVGQRLVSLGQFVDVGQTLVKLVDSSRVKISYRVPERYLARFKLGQQVKVTTSAYPGKIFSGTVDLIHPVVDEATRTAHIRALAANAEGLLLPGMFARVETIVEKRDNSIVIPESALVAALDGFKVYLVKDGVAHLTPVKIGVRGPGTVEILQGLNVDQQIVVRGTQKLVDGMKVVAAEPPKGNGQTNGKTNGVAAAE